MRYRKLEFDKIPQKVIYNGSEYYLDSNISDDMRHYNKDPEKVIKKLKDRGIKSVFVTVTWKEPKSFIYVTLSKTLC